MLDTDVDKESGHNGKNGTSEKTTIDAKVFDHIGLTVEAYIGKAQLTVSELNALAQDSVIDLDATLNQSVDLRLNGISIAQGELVAVGDKFGVRITAIS